LLGVLLEVHLGVAAGADLHEAGVSPAGIDEARLDRGVRAFLDDAALELADHAERADHELVVLAVPVDAASEAAEIQVGVRRLQEAIEGVGRQLIAGDAVGAAEADPLQSAGGDPVTDEREVQPACVLGAAAGAHRDDGARGLEDVRCGEREPAVDLSHRGLALLDVLA
jgi:hypothetical protein